MDVGVGVARSCAVRPCSQGPGLKIVRPTVHLQDVWSAREVRLRAEDVSWQVGLEVSLVFSLKDLGVASGSAVGLKSQRKIEDGVSRTGSMLRACRWCGGLFVVAKRVFAVACAVFAVFEICLLWRTRKSRE